jgi:hypothetical protein
MRGKKGRGKVKKRQNDSKKAEWKPKGKTTAQRANKCRTSPYGFFLFSNSIFELKLRLFPMHSYLLITHGIILYFSIQYIHHNLPKNIPIKRKHNLTA